MSTEQLAEVLGNTLTQRGYKLESGTNMIGTYGKGNKVLRILFGAFVKRFAFRVTITDQMGDTELNFKKEGKGMAGGAIGVAQVSNEYKRLIEVIENYHTKHHLEKEGI